MVERQLLDRISRRDETALRELYRLYQPRLTRFLRRFSTTPDMTDEVINDTLLVVWDTAHRFRGDSSPTTWIIGIAYKKMLKALQRNKPLPVPVDAPTVTGETSTDLPSALRGLSKPQAAVVVLAYEFGYSYREISQILNCPENTVKTRMFHARKALKRILEDQA